MRRIVMTTVAAVALLLFGPAALAGSDSPTPYTVDATGITLPAGVVFRDNGHVNVRWNGGAAGLHFEAKCVTRTDAECAGARHSAAQYIGRSFIPWSAFGLTDGCVTWVQLSDFNEHFGEGGQEPVCLGSEEPCPTTSPSPTPTGTPSLPSSPAPTPTTSEPSPTVSPSSMPSPIVSPSSAPTVEPTRTPTGKPSPTPSLSSPTLAPSPSIAAPPMPPAPDPSPTDDVAERVVGGLAVTGVDTGLVFMTGLYLVVGGLIAWGLSYKKRHEGGAR